MPLLTFSHNYQASPQAVKGFDRQIDSLIRGEGPSHEVVVVCPVSDVKTGGLDRGVDHLSLTPVVASDPIRYMMRDGDEVIDPGVDCDIPPPQASGNGAQHESRRRAHPIGAH